MTDKLYIEVQVAQQVRIRHDGSVKSGTVKEIREEPFPGEVDVKLNDGTVVTVPVGIGPGE